jgi:hypothetical protein
MDAIGICGDGDGDKYSSIAGIEDGEYFEGRKVGKLPPLNLRSVYIFNQMFN